MKKILIILVFIITGCSKIQDLSQLTIIKSIGITYDDKYHLYVQTIDKIDKNKIPNMQIIEIKDQTIYDAFNSLEEQSDKPIYLAHIDLLILDKNLKDTNYQEIIKYFTTNQDFRNDFITCFAKDIKNLLKNTEYDEIEIFLKNKNQETNFNTVIREFLENEKITLPSISYQNNKIYIEKYQYIKKENNNA